MDAFSSAKMMYAAVSMNEKQAAMKDKMKSTFSFRRGKRDKDDGTVATETGGEGIDEEGQADVEELAGFSPQLSLWKGGFCLGALATIGTNLFTWVTFGGPIHIIGGTATTLASTVAAYNEVTMDDINTVRKAAQLLRNAVNGLASQNVRLTGEIDRLEQQVFSLKETENRLKDITGQQDLNVKYLVSLVATNKEILSERAKLVRQDVVTDVTRMVLKADKDESGDFDDDEIKRLIKYIEELPTVKVNVKLLNKALKKNRSVGSIIDIVNDLARDDIPDKKRVFTYNFEDEKLIETLEKKKKKAKAESDEKKKKRAEKKKASSSKSVTSTKSTTTSKSLSSSVTKKSKKDLGDDDDASAHSKKSLTKSKSKKKADADDDESSKSLKKSKSSRSKSPVPKKKKAISELEMKLGGVSDSESDLDVSSSKRTTTKKKTKSKSLTGVSSESSTKVSSKASKSKSSVSLKSTLESGEKKLSKKKSKSESSDDESVRSSRSTPPVATKKSMRKAKKSTDGDDESVKSSKSATVSGAKKSIKSSDLIQEYVPRSKRSSSADASRRSGKTRSSSLGPLDDKRRKKRDQLSKSSHSERPSRAKSSGTKDSDKGGLLGNKSGPLGLGIASKMKKSIGGSSSSKTKDGDDHSV